MDDKIKRESERSAETGGVAEKASIIRQSLRTEPREKTIQRLGKMLAGVRDEVLDLTVETQDEKDILKAMTMIGGQIEETLRDSVQPREGDAPLPDAEAILRSIHKTITPEQARVLLDKKEIHEPKLLLVPITSVERYREELLVASQAMEGSRPPAFSDFAQFQLNFQAALAEVDANKIKKWKFAITEGAQTFDIPEWDNGLETYEQRIGRFNTHFGSVKITRLDYQSYIALMVRGLKKGKPLDCKYQNDSRNIDPPIEVRQQTVLSETEILTEWPNSTLGAAYWDVGERLVYLSLTAFSNRHNTGHFRPAVMGDIEV